MPPHKDTRTEIQSAVLKNCWQPRKITDVPRGTSRGDELSEKPAAFLPGLSRSRKPAANHPAIYAAFWADRQLYKPEETYITSDENQLR